METIEVRYKPIIEDSLPTGIYHKYIVYTDSNGKEWFARGGPGWGDGYEGRGGTDDSCWTEPLGNIVTESGPYVDSPLNPDWDDPEDTYDHHSETIKSGADLSSYYLAILDALEDIENENHTYGGPVHNSNTVIDTVLHRVGLPPTQDDPSHFPPGSGYFLPEETQTDLCQLADTASTYVGGAITKFGTALGLGSPIIFDLNNSDTIDLISLANAEAYWDIDQDGFRELTGWVSSDDGILAFDVNGNGILDDNGELFGTADTDGFSILAQHDSNGDGDISSEDIVWDDLIVWQDHNENGFSDDGELYSLADFDIVNIDLNATEVSQSNQGHEVTHTSTFTVDDGVNPSDTRIAHDVWFQFDNVNTIYNLDYSPEEVALFLPSLRGYGTLPYLHVSMSLDSTGTGNLLDQVLDLFLTDFSTLFDKTTNLMDAVTDIMYRWAGVDTVASDSRGPNIDARKVEFLEALMGQPFVQEGSGWQSDPGPFAAVELEEAFLITQNGIYARLAAQSAGADLFNGDFYYDIAADSLAGVTGLNQSTIDTLETEATSLANTAEREVFWQNVVRVIEFTLGTANLATGDFNYLNAAISDSDAALSLNGIVSDLSFDAPAGSTYNGTTGNDNVTGGTGDDEVNGLAGNDTLKGGQGNDDLDGADGDDDLWGEAGQDYGVGGDGNDNYHWEAGDGHDIIKEQSSGTGNDDDRIVLGTGFDSGDVTLTRITNTALLVELDNGTATGSIMIEDQFNYSAIGGHVELIEFSDTSTLDLDAQSYTLTGTAGADELYGSRYGSDGEDTIYGGAGNDTIYGHAPSETDTQNNFLYGEAGNDSIYGGDGVDQLYGGNDDDFLSGDLGNDILDGGTGENRMEGGGGDDDYVYAGGHQTIFESSGTDEIKLGAVWDSVTPTYFKIDNDLQIYFDADNTITLEWFFVSGRAVETMLYDDTTSVNLTTVSYDIQGTSGNDSLSGDSNDNTIFGFGGNDTITGSWGDDYLDGGAGDDTIDGGSGNEHYYYVSGHDSFDDQDGTEIVELVPGWEWEDLTFVRSIDDLQNLVIEINGSNSVTLKDHFYSNDHFETLRMNDGTGDVTLTTMQYETHGNESDNTLTEIINGGSLDDIMYGYGGNDTLSGDDGDDVLYGGGGDDTLNGESNNDTLDGGDGDDVMKGYWDDDLYLYSAGMDTLIDLDGSDILWMTGGITINDITVSDVSTYDAKVVVNASVDEVLVDNLRYTNSNYHVDTIKFDDGFTANLPSYNSWLKGTSGNDMVSGNTSDNVLIGYAGNDTVTASDGADHAHGGAGADTLDGGAGADMLYGGDDDDTVEGGTGADTMNGGDGTDIVDYSGDGAAVTVNLATGTATDGNADTDTLAEFENLTGSAYNDTLTGDSADNTIDGGAGADNVNGGGGSDTLNGGAGADTLNGGDGIDRINYGAEAAGVTVNLGTGSATDGGSATDTLSNAENVTGSAFADSITGDDNANELDGGAGADSLTGGAGSDVLNGGTGNDTLNGGDGTDIVDYSADATAVTVNLSTGSATDGNSDTDTISNTENVRGSGFNDTLTGGSSTNFLYGGAGNDTLNGNAGTDYLYGEAGTDTLNGGDGDDLLSGGDDVDALNGGNNNDTLYGGDGGDTLHGDAGNDVLYGMDGADILYGDGGADRFVLTNDTAFNDIDTAKDFDITTDDDVLDISNILDMNGYENGVDTLTNWVQIANSGSDSTVKVDITGAASFGAGTQIATLQGITGLTDEAALVSSGNLLIAA